MSFAHDLLKAANTGSFVSRVNPNASSSSSAVALPSGRRNKRKIESIESPVSPNNEKMARAIDKATEVFEASLEEANKRWCECNKGIIEKESFVFFNSLSKLSVDTKSKKILLNPTQSLEIEADAPSQKAIEELNKKLLNDYAGLKADARRNALGLKFLLNAIRAQQTFVVEELLKTLELSENSKEVYDCLAAAAGSTPEILKCVLAKKPRIFFIDGASSFLNSQLHTRLFSLAINFRDSSLVDSLLKIPSFILFRESAEAVVCSKSPEILRTVLANERAKEHVHYMMLKALELGLRSTAEELIKAGGGPSKALMDVVKDDIKDLSKDWSDAMRLKIERLIEWGADVNSMYNTGDTPIGILISKISLEKRGEQARTLAEEAIKWWIKKGARLDVKKYMLGPCKNLVYGNLKGQFDFRFIKNILSISENKNSFLYEMYTWAIHFLINEGIAFEIVTQICNDIEKTAEEWNIEVDVLGCLCTYVTSYRISHSNAAAQIQYLMKDQALSFGKKPLWINACWNGAGLNLRTFMGFSGFDLNEELAAMVRGDVGIWTHLALGLLSYHQDTSQLEEFKKLLMSTVVEAAKKVYQQSKMAKPAQENLFYKDVVCAHVIFAISKQSSFDFIKKLLPWSDGKFIDHKTLEDWKRDLISLVVERAKCFGIDAHRNLRTEIEIAFQDIYKSAYRAVLKSNPSHYQAALTRAILDPEQEKQLAAIDPIAALEKMLHVYPFAPSVQVAVKTFIKHITEGIYKTGMPHGIPSTFSEKEKSLYEAFEGQCRKIVVMRKTYTQVLDLFIMHRYSKNKNTVIPQGFEDIIKQLDNAIDMLSKQNDVPVTQKSLEAFIQCQGSKQKFLMELESKLSLILLAYQLDKTSAVESSKKESPPIKSLAAALLSSASSSASSSSSSSLSSKAASSLNVATESYDIDSAKTLLNTIEEFMPYCATQWTMSLHALEIFALIKIKKYSKNAASFGNQSLLESQIHTVLWPSRAELIKNWAQSTTNQLLIEAEEEAIKKGEQPNQIFLDSIRSNEVHLGLLALEHHGRYLGIPRSESNREIILEWNPNRDAQFMNHMQWHNNAWFIVRNVIDGIRRGEIQKEEVLQWMKENFIKSSPKSYAGLWIKRYARVQDKLIEEVTQKVSALQAQYETILAAHKNNPNQKESILEKELWGQFRKIFEENSCDITFNLEPIKKILTAGKEFQDVLKDLKKITATFVTQEKEHELIRDLYEDEEAKAFKTQHIMMMLKKMLIINDRTPQEYQEWFKEFQAFQESQQKRVQQQQQQQEQQKIIAVQAQIEQMQALVQQLAPVFKRLVEAGQPAAEQALAQIQPVQAAEIRAVALRVFQQPEGLIPVLMQRGVLAPLLAPAVQQPVAPANAGAIGQAGDPRANPE